MPTLILSPRHTEDSQVLWRAAGRLGWQVERLASWRVPEALKLVEEPVLYVEALMAPMLAASLGLTLAEPPEDWLPTLPDDYRRRRVRLGTLGEARANADPVFVKPPNDKSFSAAVYRGPELPTEFADDMPVLTAEVVTWDKEFRCFVLDRELKAFSVYLRNGVLQKESDYESTPEEDAELKEYVSRLLRDPRVQLPRAVVLDVGVIRDRGWAVVEANSAWGAGIYGCDPAQVLEVLRYTAVRRVARGGTST